MSMTSGQGEQAFGGHWPCVVPPKPLLRPEPCPQGALCLQIREEIDHYGIRIYQFPECDSDEDEEFKLQDQALKVGLAPLVPSLEGQSPVARRTHHPGVTCRTLWGHASSPTWRGWHISHYPDTSPSSHG